MSMKISNDIIGNRTRGLPACSAVVQPTVPQREIKKWRVKKKGTFLITEIILTVVWDMTPYIPANK
jgi:hypothetical protein